jgi:hypothetical protein
MQTALFEIERVNMGSHKQRAARYHNQLTAVLGKGSDWEYRGECQELEAPSGKCACGQVGLRFLFTVHHPDGRRAILGSSCIVTYEGISPETAAAVQADADRLLNAGAERERKAREASRANDVQALLAQWTTIEFEMDRLCAAWHAAHPWQRLPYGIYQRDPQCNAAERFKRLAEGKSHPFVRIPALKTKNGQIKRLTDKLAAARLMLAQIRGYF